MMREYKIDVQGVLYNGDALIDTNKPRFQSPKLSINIIFITVIMRLTTMIIIVF